MSVGTQENDNYRT